MFREMRRHRQLLPPEEIAQILAAGSSGVLALAGDEGWPYAVPLSYAYTDGSLYFHCAREGHKLDALRREPRASFCVIAQDDVVPEKYTTRYRSVIAFGRLQVLEDENEKRAVLKALAEKYSPAESEASHAAVIARTLGSVCIVKLTVEHFTGKEGKELTQEREQCTIKSEV